MSRMVGAGRSGSPGGHRAGRVLLPPPEPSAEHEDFYSLLPLEMWEKVIGLDWRSVLNFRWTSPHGLQIVSGSKLPLAVTIDETKDREAEDWRLGLRFRKLNIVSFNRGPQSSHPQALLEICLQNNTYGEHRGGCDCEGKEEGDTTPAISPQNLVYLLGQGKALQNLELNLRFSSLVSDLYLEKGFDFENLKRLEIHLRTPSACLSQFCWSPLQNLASLLLTKSNMPKLGFLRVWKISGILRCGPASQLTADVLKGVQRFGQNLRTLEFYAQVPANVAGGLDFAPDAPRCFKLSENVSKVRLTTNIYLDSWALFLRALRNLVDLNMHCEDSPPLTPLTCAVVGEVVAKNASTLEDFCVSYVLPGKVLVDEILVPGVDLRPFGLCDRLTLLVYRVPYSRLVNLNCLPPQIKYVALYRFHISTVELLAFSSRTDMQTWTWTLPISLPW